MESHSDLLQATYQALQGSLALGPPQGPPVTVPPEAGGSLRAYQMVDTPASPACLEVHQEPAGASPAVWVCVPRLGLPGIAISQHYDWYRYRRGASGIVPDGGPLQIVPPYGPWPTADPTPAPQPLLAMTGDWSHRASYFIAQVLLPGTDPPHWSPILVLTDEDQPFIGGIHARMQNPATRAAAVKLLNRARPGPAIHLSQRVMNNWQPVTLRGFAWRSSFTEHDFSVDHAMGYNRVGSGGDLETPLGAIWQADLSDPNSPGLDWHIDINPDPDLRYLSSPAQPDRVAVEIEHFALPVEYRPLRGEWLQVTGRWVTDVGHIETGRTAIDGFHTEIHPEELLVASRPDPQHPLGTMARVIATGAWQGLPLSFVVNPPPRPSPAARLRWAIADEWRQRATLTLTLWPANANHLIGVIETTDTAPLLIRPNGVVGMTDTRGYHAIITCWWDVPVARVTGRLVPGSVLFYAPAGAGPPPWRRAVADASGIYTLPALLPGPYLFRPAGTAWNYTGVPRQVVVAAGAQEVSFPATPAPPPPGAPGDLVRYPPHREESPAWQALLRPDAQAPLGPDHPLRLQSWTFDGRVLQAPSLLGDATRDLGDDQLAILAVGPQLGLNLTARQVAAPAPTPGDLGVLSAQADAFLTLRAPTGPFGVHANRLGYAEGGRWYMNLARLDDSQGQPINDAARALSRIHLAEVDRAGHPWIMQDVIQIHGMEGPGVAGATVRARLWMIGVASAARLMAEATGTTDAQGTARFDLLPGTHVAEVVLTLEVLRNPGNAWLLPRVRLGPYLFYPAATGDDSRPAQPYTLSVAARPAAPGPGADQEARLQRSADRGRETQTAVRDLSADTLAEERGLGLPPQPIAPPPLVAPAPVNVAQLETVRRNNWPRPTR